MAFCPANLSSAGRISVEVQGLPVTEQDSPGQKGQAGPRERTMAEKIKKLSLQRDYKQFLYFIDGEGNVCQKPKSGKGDSKVLVEKAVDRDNQFLYFIDKEGDVSRSPRGTKHKKAA
jgi:hypothetical protein